MRYLDLGLYVYEVVHYSAYHDVLVLLTTRHEIFSTQILDTKTRLFKYIENFTSKNRKFSDKKKSDIFHISAQNIDCVYSLEPPWRGGSNEYPKSMFLSRNKKNNVRATPVNPSFNI